MQYQHRQPGTFALAVIVATIAVVLAPCVLIGIRVPEAHSTLLLIAIPTLVILALLAWYFSSMTVTVTDDELRWSFGLGGEWRIARADIEAAAVVPHRWIGGYGLRWYGPKRWVYIVSGRETVEVRLKQGGWRRLGTDDAQGLLSSLASKPAPQAPLVERQPTSGQGREGRMRAMPAFPIIMASMLFVAAGDGYAAGIGVCEAYVAEAMEAAQKVRDMQCGYDLDHPQWMQDPDVHRRWCRESRDESVDEENISRRAKVSRCTICRGYTNQALAAADVNEKLACGFTGPRWSTDPNVHFGWCMAARGPRGGGVVGAIAGLEGPVEMTLDPESAERDREAAQCRMAKESKPKSQTSSLQTRSKSSAPAKPRSNSATSAATPAKPAAKAPASTRTGGSSAMDRLSGASTPARTVGPGVLRPGILESGILDAGRGAPSPSGAGTGGASRNTTGSGGSGPGTIDFGRGGSGAPAAGRLR
jgi:hypothetical protein